MMTLLIVPRDAPRQRIATIPVALGRNTAADEPTLMMTNQWV